jgi:hypothetical protein
MDGMGRNKKLLHCTDEICASCVMVGFTSSLGAILRGSEIIKM